MERSLNNLYKNFMAWINWIQPHYFHFMYYYSFPAVVILGKHHMLSF